MRTGHDRYNNKIQDGFHGQSGVISRHTGHSTGDTDEQDTDFSQNEHFFNTKFSYT